MSETEFIRQAFAEIDNSMIDALKKRAAHSPLRRARYCLHPDPSHPLNVMVIALCRDTYLRPHRFRPDKSKVYHLIEGDMDVVFFDNEGDIIKRIEMGERHTKKTFLCRWAEQIWHTPFPRTDTVVYEEITQGPFVKELDAEYALWSPAEDDTAGIAILQKKIMENGPHPQEINE